MPLQCVKTPDDGQRNCPKHVEFHFKNEFEKLVHLVGFIIRNITVPPSLGSSILKTARTIVQSHNTHITEDVRTQQWGCEKITLVSNSVSKTH